MKQILTILFVLEVISTPLFAQKYSEETLRTTLDTLATKHPGLNNQLQLNVSNLQLSELVNSVALENNLNVSIDPGLNQMISYNFFDAQVKDMLVFLYLNFELEYDFIGSIVSIRKRDKVAEPVAVKPPRQVDVRYNPANKFLSMNLKNDTLHRVVEELTKISEQNFVVDPGVRDKIVNAYFLNRPYEQVLEMFVQSNELLVEKIDEYYRISGNVKSKDNPNPDRRPGTNFQSNRKNGDLVITKNPVGTVDVMAKNVELNDIIQAAAEETDVHYVLYSALTGKGNLDVKDVRFDELAQMLFKGTSFGIKDQDGIFVIGEDKQEGLRITEMIRLENRTIESVKEAIPADMLQGLEVKEFNELNGLIITGSQRKISELRTFIESIDVIVPMVQIDVMLLYSKKGSSVNTGIKAGISETPVETSGDIFPGLDITMGSQSINNLLNAISGFGFVNLGQVTESFYVSLSALESNNIVEIESTPKISTLNGHEANISIGETTYYQETQVNVQTSVTNQGVLQSQQWKSIDANLTVKILPFVSADEHVTLGITVEQDAFNGVQGPGAPPDLTTRTFESTVRVKNGELILLGGLDSKTKSDAGSGVPIISRIPILKWLFSSRQKDREKSKLHILIRPIVTY